MNIIREKLMKGAGRRWLSLAVCFCVAASGILYVRGVPPVQVMAAESEAEMITGNQDGWTFEYLNQLDGNQISIADDHKPQIRIGEDFSSQSTLNDIPAADGTAYYDLIGVFLTQTNGTEDTSDDIIREITEIRHINDQYYAKIKGSRQNYIVFNQNSGKLKAYYRTYYKVTVKDRTSGQEFVSASVDAAKAKLMEGYPTGAAGDKTYVYKVYQGTLFNFARKGYTDRTQWKLNQGRFLNGDQDAAPRQSEAVSLQARVYVDGNDQTTDGIVTEGSRVGAETANAITYSVFPVKSTEIELTNREKAGRTFQLIAGKTLGSTTTNGFFGTVTEAYSSNGSKIEGRGDQPLPAGNVVSLSEGGSVELFIKSIRGGTSRPSNISNDFMSKLVINGQYINLPMPLADKLTQSAYTQLKTGETVVVNWENIARTKPNEYGRANATYKGQPYNTYQRNIYTVSIYNIAGDLTINDIGYLDANANSADVRGNIDWHYGFSLLSAYGVDRESIIVWDDRTWDDDSYEKVTEIPFGLIGISGSTYKNAILFKPDNEFKAIRTNVNHQISYKRELSSGSLYPVGNNALLFDTEHIDAKTVSSVFDQNDQRAREAAGGTSGAYLKYDSYDSDYWQPSILAIDGFTNAVRKSVNLAFKERDLQNGETVQSSNAIDNISEFKEASGTALWFPNTRIRSLQDTEQIRVPGTTALTPNKKKYFTVPALPEGYDYYTPVLAVNQAAVTLENVGLRTDVKYLPGQLVYVGDLLDFTKVGSTEEVWVNFLPKKYPSLSTKAGNLRAENLVEGQEIEVQSGAYPGKTEAIYPSALKKTAKDYFGNLSDVQEQADTEGFAYELVNNHFSEDYSRLTEDKTITDELLVSYGDRSAEIIPLEVRLKPQPAASVTGQDVTKNWTTEQSAGYSSTDETFTIPVAAFVASKTPDEAKVTIKALANASAGLSLNADKDAVIVSNKTWSGEALTADVQLSASADGLAAGDGTAKLTVNRIKTATPAEAEAPVGGKNIIKVSESMPLLTGSGFSVSLDNGSTFRAAEIIASENGVYTLQLPAFLESGQVVKVKATAGNAYTQSDILTMSAASNRQSANLSVQNKEMEDPRGDTDQLLASTTTPGSDITLASKNDVAKSARTEGGRVVSIHPGAALWLAKENGTPNDQLKLAATFDAKAAAVAATADTAGYDAQTKEVTLTLTKKQGAAVQLTGYSGEYSFHVSIPQVISGLTEEAFVQEGKKLTYKNTSNGAILEITTGNEHANMRVERISTDASKTELTVAFDRTSDTSGALQENEAITVRYRADAGYRFHTTEGTVTVEPSVKPQIVTALKTETNEFYVGTRDTNQPFDASKGKITAVEYSNRGGADTSWSTVSGFTTEMQPDGRIKVTLPDSYLLSGGSGTQLRVAYDHDGSAGHYTPSYSDGKQISSKESIAPRIDTFTSGDQNISIRVEKGRKQGRITDIQIYRDGNVVASATVNVDVTAGDNGFYHASVPVADITGWTPQIGDRIAAVYDQDTDDAYTPKESSAEGMSSVGQSKSAKPTVLSAATEETSFSVTAPDLTSSGKILSYVIQDASGKEWLKIDADVPQSFLPASGQESARIVVRLPEGKRFNLDSGFQPLYRIQAVYNKNGNETATNTESDWKDTVSKSSNIPSITGAVYGTRTFQVNVKKGLHTGTLTKVMIGERTLTRNDQLNAEDTYTVEGPKEEDGTLVFQVKFEGSALKMEDTILVEYDQDSAQRGYTPSANADAADEHIVRAAQSPAPSIDLPVVTGDRLIHITLPKGTDTANGRVTELKLIRGEQTYTYTADEISAVSDGKGGFEVTLSPKTGDKPTAFTAKDQLMAAYDHDADGSAYTKTVSEKITVGAKESEKPEVLKSSLNAGQNTVRVRVPDTEPIGELTKILLYDKDNRPVQPGNYTVEGPYDEKPADGYKYFTVTLPNPLHTGDKVVAAYDQDAGDAYTETYSYDITNLGKEGKEQPDGAVPSDMGDQGPGTASTKAPKTEDTSFTFTSKIKGETTKLTVTDPDSGVVRMLKAGDDFTGTTVQNEDGSFTTTIQLNSEQPYFKGGELLAYTYEAPDYKPAVVSDVTVLPKESLIPVVTAKVGDPTLQISVGRGKLTGKVVKLEVWHQNADGSYEKQPEIISGPFGERAGKPEDHPDTAYFEIPLPKDTVLAAGDLVIAYYDQDPDKGAYLVSASYDKDTKGGPLSGKTEDDGISGGSDPSNGAVQPSESRLLIHPVHTGDTSLTAVGNHPGKISGVKIFRKNADETEKTPVYTLSGQELAQISRSGLNFTVVLSNDTYSGFVAGDQIVVAYDDDADGRNYLPGEFFALVLPSESGDVRIDPVKEDDTEIQVHVPAVTDGSTIEVIIDGKKLDSGEYTVEKKDDNTYVIKLKDPLISGSTIDIVYDRGEGYEPSGASTVVEKRPQSQPPKIVGPVTDGSSSFDVDVSGTSAGSELTVITNEKELDRNDYTVKKKDSDTFTVILKEVLNKGNVITVSYTEKDGYKPAHDTIVVAEKAQETTLTQNQGKKNHAIFAVRVPKTGDSAVGSILLYFGMAAGALVIFMMILLLRRRRNH